MFQRVPFAPNMDTTTGSDGFQRVGLAPNTDTTRMFLDVSGFFFVKNDKDTVENQITYLLSYDSYVPLYI